MASARRQLLAAHKARNLPPKSTSFPCHIDFLYKSNPSCPRTRLRTHPRKLQRYTSYLRSIEAMANITLQKPINLGLCTIGDGLFVRVADLNVNDGRVTGCCAHLGSHPRYCFPAVQCICSGRGLSYSVARLGPDPSRSGSSTSRCGPSPSITFLSSQASPLLRLGHPQSLLTWVPPYRFKYHMTQSGLRSVYKPPHPSPIFLP